MRAFGQPDTLLAEGARQIEQVYIQLQSNLVWNNGCTEDNLIHFSLKAAYTSGKISNFMSNDADKVVPFAFQMPWLVQIPLNILIAFGLIIRLLGWAGVAGALVMVALGEGGGVILMPPPCAFHPCLSIQNK